MRRIYSFILYMLIPAVLIRLLWRSIKAPNYRQRIKERFGFVSTLQNKNSVWIHAASIGEVQASIPLIKHFLHSYPQFTVVVTTTTPTGSRRVQELFGLQIYHCYIPYDIPIAVRRFISVMQPQLAIFIETEVWPNVLHECKSKNIPTILANARLSENSARGYARLGNFARYTFNNFTHIATQSTADAERLIKLGVNENRLTVISNIKFDLQLAPDVYKKGLILRELLGKERPIWIAASTHEGEDEQLLIAHKEVLYFIPNALLVLVPRHPERFNAVKQLILKQGFNVISRSEQRPCNAEYQVFLGDSMGELTTFFAAVDIAFVGGSLVPRGGHNMLEPAALEKPIIIGPHVINFASIANKLLIAGAAKQVTTSNELALVVVAWLKDITIRHNIGEQGRLVVENNRGAMDRLIKVINHHWLQHIAQNA